MSLQMLLGLGIVQFEGSNTSAGHEEVGDVLDVIDLLGVSVLFDEQRVIGIIRDPKDGSELGEEGEHTLKILRISLFPTTVYE